MPHSGMRVLESPGGGDAAVSDGEDVHLGDVVEAAAGGRMAAPVAAVGAGAGEPADDLVGFGDELDDRHLEVRKGLAERGDPAAGVGCQRGRVEVVDELHVAGVHDLRRLIHHR